VDFYTHLSRVSRHQYDPRLPTGISHNTQQEKSKLSQSIDHSFYIITTINMDNLHNKSLTNRMNLCHLSIDCKNREGFIIQTILRNILQKYSNKVRKLPPQLTPKKVPLSLLRKTGQKKHICLNVQKYKFPIGSTTIYTINTCALKNQNSINTMKVACIKCHMKYEHQQWTLIKYVTINGSVKLQQQAIHLPTSDFKAIFTCTLFMLVQFSPTHTCHCFVVFQVGVLFTQQFYDRC
jgi:hypothetical protein